MYEKIKKISLYTVPIIVMIGLIPFIKNDFVLAVVYVVFIGALLFFRSERNDLLALAVGLIAISFSEAFFVSTGVEVFLRNNLFGIMPLWLPLLWAYVFVTIKRCLRILDR